MSLASILDSKRRVCGRSFVPVHQAKRAAVTFRLRLFCQIRHTKYQLPQRHGPSVSSSWDQQGLAILSRSCFCVAFPPSSPRLRPLPHSRAAAPRVSLALYSGQTNIAHGWALFVPSWCGASQGDKGEWLRLEPTCHEERHPSIQIGRKRLNIPLPRTSRGKRVLVIA
jgi:hypothetical protein